MGAHPAEFRVKFIHVAAIGACSRLRRSLRSREDALWASARAGGLQTIQHVIIIMQENRSFDHYFGTFPGADGIPMLNGLPTVCVPDPIHGTCVMPFHTTGLVQTGGPHSHNDAIADIDGGRMDGFLMQAEQQQGNCINPLNPNCPSKNPLSVVVFHDAREIPNYWAYAQTFVLQDRMFEPNSSWSLVSHLYMVSEWSAHCTKHSDPASCVNALQSPGNPPGFLQPNLKPPIYAWTDLTFLLHQAGVSWGYYVSEGLTPDCLDPTEAVCVQTKLSPLTPGIWNPLPWFDTVKADSESANVQPVANFLSQAAAGTLPSVAWVVPSQLESEHPPASIADGQAFVTGLVNAVMQGPNWGTCAIFISWDDWGGFYDHVVPPKVDQNGYGLRVPGLMISPFAKAGLIDHQTLSFDAYVKFIEDLFLGGQRLDPRTDGRPDPRPAVRESASRLGDLAKEFDFTQTPLPPLILPLRPPPGPASVP